MKLQADDLRSCRCSGEATLVSRLLGLSLIRKVGVMVLPSLILLSAGCAVLSVGYRYTLDHNNVEGNLAGPYMPIGAISPTAIKTVLDDGGVQKEVVLELRGVVSPPDAVASNAAAKWLRWRVVDWANEGLFVLKDTLIDCGNGLVKGVVLYPLQRSVFHDIATGRTVTLVSRYGVLQCDALNHGRLLQAKDSASFSWGRDFAHFQQEARQDRLGYWDSRSTNKISKGQTEQTENSR